MELDAQPPHDYRRGGLTLSSVNKVHHVHTIARVAEMLGEDEDWLWDVASEMDQEDGLIWVYGPGEESVMAFTDFGRDLQSQSRPPQALDQCRVTLPAAYAECLRSCKPKPGTRVHRPGKCPRYPCSSEH